MVTRQRFLVESAALPRTQAKAAGVGKAVLGEIAALVVEKVVSDRCVQRSRQTRVVPEYPGRHHRRVLHIRNASR